MSMSQFGKFNTALPSVSVGPVDELVATVPDLHFGVVNDCVAELNDIESFGYSRKRNHSDSGCSLSDFELSGDEDLLNIVKRPCATVCSSPYVPGGCVPLKDFTFDIDAVNLGFTSGTVSSSGDTALFASGGVVTYSALQPFSDCTVCPETTQGVASMQASDLQLNTYKHDAMLSCDQDCKLVITEHPEEVSQKVKN